MTLACVRVTKTNQVRALPPLQGRGGPGKLRGYEVDSPKPEPTQTQAEARDGGVRHVCPAFDP